MLENQFVQKSRECSGIQVSPGDSSNANPKVYVEVDTAIREFDSESKIEKQEYQQDPRIGLFLQNAKILMNHRDFNLALNLIRQSSNIDSRNPLVLEMLATCLEKVGKLSEAFVARRVLVQVEYSYNSLSKFGNLLYKMGNDQEALEKYYEGLSILTFEDESLFEVYKNMGNIFVRQGDFEAAEEFYNKAYTLNSNSDVLLVNFGTLEVQRNQYNKALYCFRKAIEINSVNDKGWVGLAMVHNHFGDAELAWANIEAALDVNPQNRTAVHLAANWGVREFRSARVIEFLESYLSSVEQDEEMSLVLINLYCASGLYDLAQIEIERVLLWNPGHKEVAELKKKLALIQRGDH